jgi:cellulose synthase/poly-beta-1,6-N-acetylglucosamine synthase-like glycosyltransferase
MKHSITSMMARGIDVEQVTIFVNYELPVDVKGKAVVNYELPVDVSGKAVVNYELPVDVNGKAVIWRVFSRLFDEFLFSDLSNEFSLSYLTSFILGFVQQVFSLLFVEFYSLCYFTSFILGFGEFSLEGVTSKV